MMTTNEIKMAAQNIETAKNYLFVRLYPRTDKYVNQDFLDLSIIPVLEFPSEHSVATVKITEEMLKIWRVAKSEIIFAAMENTYKRGFVAQTMIEMLMGLSPKMIFDEISSIDKQMYVVTNKEKMFGATAMLDKELLRRICRKMDVEKIYIIPSSVHEILIVPETIATYKEVASMICDINKAEVVDEEVLGNHPYIYSMETNMITM